jgi:hypothetical protein
MPSMAEAHQALNRASRHDFELKVDSLERENTEMLHEFALLEMELEQVKAEIEKVQNDQVRTINSNLEQNR